MMKTSEASEAHNRYCHYSDGLGFNEMKHLQDASGLGAERIREIFQEVETNPECATVFWESVLQKYPVDWRDAKATPNYFHLYGYSAPLTFPALIPGVLTNPGRQRRIQKAFAGNEAIFKAPILALSAHRSTYSDESLRSSRAAEETFVGDVRDKYIAQAAVHHVNDHFWSEDSRQAHIKSTAMTMHRADTFAEFCSKREEETAAFNKEIYKDFDGLNAYQMHCKLFVEHVLPAYEKNLAPTQQRAASRSGPSL